MTLYMSFPVSAYYLFNRPDLFEKSYIETAKKQRERYENRSTSLTDPKEQRRKMKEEEMRQQAEECERQEKLYKEKLLQKQSPPVI